jgi:hypothetical protein
MTMEHISRSFSVSLSITHPSIDPAEITKTTGLTPKRMTREGMPRTTPAGDDKPGHYQFSCWSHSFATADADLGPVLEHLVGQLQVHQAFFQRIVNEGGAVELFCGVFADGNWDEVLCHHLLGKLAALQIDLRLDVYPKGEVAP